jgi:hypothetical protein
MKNLASGTVGEASWRVYDFMSLHRFVVTRTGREDFVRGYGRDAADAVRLAIAAAEAMAGKSQ